MKSAVALFFGLLLILAALLIAATATKGDTAPRPEIAAAFATELHTTPSVAPTPTGTPTATLTPTVTPTRLHLAELMPPAPALLALLFQYPYRGKVYDVSGARVQYETYSEDSGPHLVVTGDRLSSFLDRYPLTGSFAAVLVREDGEYRVAFLRAFFDHGYMLVDTTIAPGGAITFHFYPLSANPTDTRVGHLIVLQPCRSSHDRQPEPAGSPPSGSSESACY